MSIQTIPITEHISYLNATAQPLSADIGIVEGEKYIWLYDVGNNEEALELVGRLGNSGKELRAIMSHFHPDHMGNLKKMCIENMGTDKKDNVEPDAEKIRLAEIYVGANTYGYTHCGQIVTNDIYIEDGVMLHIFPLPSSHAKGCVGLEINGEYAFLGDATYSTKKDGKIVYNATFLAEEIKVLKKLEAKYFLLSHQEKFVQKKEDVLGQLNKIYSRRQKGDPYIALYH